MGHHQLAGLPRTPAFKRVIALLGNGAGGGGTIGVGPGTLEEIANATMDASDEGLERAKSDEGVGFCVYLMAELTRAANQDDFAAALSKLGFPTPFAPTGTPDFVTASAGTTTYTVFDLVGGFTDVVDQHLKQTRSRTDIGEMAQLTAAESLSSLCSQRAVTLFGETHETVQESLDKLSSEKGFARLTHDFFARFSRRYIEYHLSRELSNHVGLNRRFGGTESHNDFLRQLDDHCRVATGVVRQFAGEWYGKHKFQKDITLRKSKYFAAHAIDKIRDALRYQEGQHAD